MGWNMGVALESMMEQPQELQPQWLLIAALVVAALLLAAVLVLSVRLRDYQRAVKRNREYDLVTGIGNKVYFKHRFRQWISDQCRDIPCVAFIGFDITRVNQYYGEAEAEEQLRFTANELMLSTGENELAARVSGGGFAVARPCESNQAAKDWAEALLGRLNRFPEKYGRDYHPDFRIGIYMLQSSDRDSETVLFNAQQGYQRAVNDDVPYAFAWKETLRRESEMRELRKQTPAAIRNREFHMYLQFIVRGTTGAISGAEALSRWDHPQRGLLHPGSYIGLMESEKTISRLDFYIFEETCRELENWHRLGYPQSISCNFARITFDYERFIPQLKAIVDRYSFPRSHLVIEITEDAMERNKEKAFDNVSKCKELGFRIALDDAGSGFTSFSDLLDYPIDIVKIDRSILNAAASQKGKALLKGMISLVHSLNMEVLCEGVENAEQLEMLRQLGCDYMQGYYFYRAIPKEEAAAFLAESRECAKTQPI